MIAGGIKRILQMVHLQPRSLHDLKKSESSVNHLEERILEKYSSHGIFFRKLLGQRVFFPSDYDIKSEKEDETEKILARQKNKRSPYGIGG